MPDPIKRPFWRRWWFRVPAGLVIALGLALVVFYFYSNSVGERELAAARADLDRLFPDGWQFQQVLDRRPALAGPNPAAALPELGVALKGWLSFELASELEQVPPEQQLPANLMGRLRTALSPVSPSVATCRNFQGQPAGRLQERQIDSWFGKMSADAEAVRRVAGVLSIDAKLRAEDGNVAGALESLLAALSVSGWLADEPTAMAQLTRISISRFLFQATERVLAQGQPPPEKLAELQALAADLERRSPFPIALTGEAGLTDARFEDLAAGRVQLHELIGVGPASTPNFFDRVTAEALRLFYLKRGQALALHYIARAVEASRLPHHERVPSLQRLQEELRTSGPSWQRPHAPYASLLLPPISKLHDNSLRYHAEMRALVAALAAERYRVATNRWPENLDALVPTYLPAVPLDPGTGLPLKLKRLPEGLMIYGVGGDGHDHGGNVGAQAFDATRIDRGVRLWDVEKRRQPPLPPKEKDE